MEQSAQITKTGVLDMQVCVPQDWTDDQVKEFADMRIHVGLPEDGQLGNREANFSLVPTRECVVQVGQDSFISCSTANTNIIQEKQTWTIQSKSK